MDAFGPVTAAFSMILGLGATRLLLSGVALFRSRARASLDWLPMAWGGCIFLQQLQFLWGLIELHDIVAVWTLGSFFAMVGLVLMLYIAAALVLPTNELREGESLRAMFTEDGRWGLAALSAYNLLALGIDVLFWGWRETLRGAGLLIPMIFVPAVFLMIRSRPAQALLTGLYVALSLASAWMLSPYAY